MQFCAGVYYHFYNRGAHKVSLFRDDDDFLRLVRLLKQYSQLLQVSIIAYCLMPNHYHWLVRQDGDIEARFLPQRVFNSYSHAFNQRRAHSGTLLEGPFKVIRVDSDEYLRHLCRYIHANPVRHGFAAKPGLWTYSNYLEWVGERNGTLVDKEFVRQHFASADAYRAYVISYLAHQVVLPAALERYLQELDSRQ